MVAAPGPTAAPDRALRPIRLVRAFIANGGVSINNLVSGHVAEAYLTMSRILDMQSNLRHGSTFYTFFIREVDEAVRTRRLEGEVPVWPEPAGKIVGAEDVYAQVRRWLDDVGVGPGARPSPAPAAPASHAGGEGTGADDATPEAGAHGDGAADPAVATSVTG
jgi:hypothetical protein